MEGFYYTFKSHFAKVVICNCGCFKFKSETHSDHFWGRGIDWESYRGSILYFDLGENSPSGMYTWV